nr:hypothetical protein [uncultured Mediterranean phage uvMED]
MADQIKQIAFREFSLTEIQAGTPWNAIQSGATDAYVVKTILATQGQDTTTGAITATATVGLTTDFNNGKYASIGTIAKQNRIGVSGSQVVDANSTLTVRPVAKTIEFQDKTFHIDTESNVQPRKSRTELRGSVMGIQDVSSGLNVDKTGVTMASQQSGHQYQGGGNTYQHQYTIYHTNVNGVHLRIIFSNDSSSTSRFQVHNANDGTMYGYYQTSYGHAMFDGERYIYWFDEGSNKIRYFDTDESTSNLSAANTYGGGQNASYYHGIINFNGSAPSGSNTSYDNHFVDFEIKDGIPYFFYLRGNGNYFHMVQLPTTLTNYNATANTTTKHVRLWSGQTSSTANNFGTNGYTMGYLNNAITRDYRGSIRVTYDAEIEYWICYHNVNQADSTFVGIFTQADYDLTPSGNYIRGENWGSSGYGLVCLTEAEIRTHLKIPNALTGTANSQGTIDGTNIYNNIKPTGDSWSYDNMSERYWDGRKLYVLNASSTGSKQFHCYELDLPNDKGTDITAAVSGNIANYNGRFYMSKSTPSNATIASRTYNNAPSLTVLISGVHENRS